MVVRHCMSEAAWAVTFRVAFQGPRPAPPGRLRLTPPFKCPAAGALTGNYYGNYYGNGYNNYYGNNYYGER